MNAAMPEDVPFGVQLHDAYARGVVSHDAGVPRDRCPFTVGRLVREWLDGWDDAERSPPREFDG